MKEFLLQFIQHAMWPAVSILIIFLFRQDLKILVSGLRQLRAGSIEVVFGKRFEKLGLNGNEIEALKALDYEDISFFLLSSYSSDPEFKYEPALTTANFHGKLQNLENAGLIVIANPENALGKREHYVTPTGKRLRSIIIESTARLFQEHS